MHELDNYITPASPRFLDAISLVVYDLNDLQYIAVRAMYASKAPTTQEYGEKVLTFTHHELKKLSRMCMRSPRDKLLAIYTHISVLANIGKRYHGKLYTAVLDCKSKLFATLSDWIAG